MKPHNIDNIDNYVAGRMNATESEAFEKLMSQDPALQNEVSLQQDVANSLSNQRKLELKSRLNEIPVSSANTFSGLHLAAATFFLGIITIAGIAKFSSSPESTEPVKELPVQVTQNQEAENIETADENVITPSDAIDQPIAAEDVEAPSVVNDQNVENPKPVNLPTNLGNPDVASADELEDDPVIDDSEQPEVIIENWTKTAKGNFDGEVKTKFSNKHLRYTYIDDRLELIGPFSDKLPYVLDVKNDGKLVLQFNNNEYNLIKGQVQKDLD